MVAHQRSRRAEILETSATARETNGTERLLLFQLFCGDPFERRSSQKFQVFLHILYDILYSVSLNETNIGPDDVGILKHDE